MAKAALWTIPDAEMRKPGERTGLETPVVGWRVVEVSRIPGVVVKYVDIRWNTGGDGGLLARH